MEIAPRTGKAIPAAKGARGRYILAKPALKPVLNCAAAEKAPPFKMVKAPPTRLDQLRLA
jgi:hypothetical protein